MAFEKEMQILTDAERNRKPIGPVSDLVAGGLSLDDAYRIMERNIEKRLTAGEKHVGYKIGFTNLAVREKMGLPDSTYGYLLDSMVLKNGVKVNMSDLIAPKIECEICMKIKSGLKGKGLSPEDVIKATEAVSASFEICDARIKDWKCPYPDFFADNGFSARIVLTASGVQWRDLTSLMKRWCSPRPEKNWPRARALWPWGILPRPRHGSWASWLTATKGSKPVRS